MIGAFGYLNVLSSIWAQIAACMIWERYDLNEFRAAVYAIHHPPISAMHRQGLRSKGILVPY